MLRDILGEQEIVTVEPDVTVEEAAHIMADKNVGTVMVLTNGKPRGILSDRDIVTRCLAKDIDVSDCTVENIMSETLNTCRDTDGIHDCIAKMNHARVRRIPVVDDAGKVCGIVSFDDLVRILGKEINMLAQVSESYSGKPPIMDQPRDDLRDDLKEAA